MRLKINHSQLQNARSTARSWRAACADISKPIHGYRYARDGTKTRTNNRIDRHHASACTCKSGSLHVPDGRVGKELLHFVNCSPGTLEASLQKLFRAFSQLMSSNILGCEICVCSQFWAQCRWPKGAWQ
uniref:Uncharacterized protein n=1 Tax=Lotharella oceanica TaxID=641309 RepID=A0A7S2TMI1_9EUKA|mmetsp:Transcript_20527/g.38592  ORF Transcript_20527/g.38592 Transcript_20527/m.38592 type:complete len:129 (+) Transcript_20527:197-583(+)